MFPIFFPDLFVKAIFCLSVPTSTRIPNTAGLLLRNAYPFKNVNLQIGDQVSIRKEGFIDNDGSKPTGKYRQVHSIKQGTYTITADLEQIPGGRFAFNKHSDGSTKQVTNVNFRVTSDAGLANKITIPGVFSVGQDGLAFLDQNLMKNIEVGKEYDVVLSSSRGRPRLRLSGGRTLQVDDGGSKDWDDLVCTITDGEFYQVSGNRCKFKLSETVKGINPMVLAVDVEVVYSTKSVICLLYTSDAADE